MVYMLCSTLACANAADAVEVRNGENTNGGYSTNTISLRVHSMIVEEEEHQ